MSTNQKLATVESVTGGLVSFWLTSHPGASQVFLGSVVSYAESIKKNVLKVRSETIQKHSIISTEVALEMASSVKHSFSADWVLAVTGSAGSNSDNTQKEGRAFDSLGQEVGKVCYALLGPNLQELKEKSFLSQNRQEIQHQIADFALDLMIFGMK